MATDAEGLQGETQVKKPYTPPEPGEAQNCQWPKLKDASHGLLRQRTQSIGHAPKLPSGSGVNLL